jgi:transposase
MLGFSSTHSTSAFSGGFRYNPTISGKVVAHVRDRRTTVDFLSFMDDVVKSYLLGELHVVLDNLNIHKNEAAKQWLLRHPRVHFHYTPTHASWMNTIECFFSVLTKQALTQSVQRSKKDLKDFLLRYLKKYSQNPTPFTWTKGAGTLPAHHRSHQGVPSSPSKEAQATESPS